MNYKTRPGGVASGKQIQLKYNDKAKADKQLQVLTVPDQVIADATTAQLVGKGNLLRVEGASGAYLAFGDDSIAAPDVNTQNAIKTPADFFNIVATDDYVRTSAAMRIEVIED